MLENTRTGLIGSSMYAMKMLLKDILATYTVELRVQQAQYALERQEEEPATLQEHQTVQAPFLALLHLVNSTMPTSGFLFISRAN